MRFFSILARFERSAANWTDHRGSHRFREWLSGCKTSYFKTSDLRPQRSDLRDSGPGQDFVFFNAGDLEFLDKFTSA